MPNRATVRTRTLHRQKHPRSSTTGRAHAHRRRRSGLRISRTRVNMLQDELNATRDVITDTFHKFWIIPEGDIRETLAATQQRIGRAVNMLRRAA
jgi:hypothetical protein